MYYLSRPSAHRILQIIQDAPEPVWRERIAELYGGSTLAAVYPLIGALLEARFIEVIHQDGGPDLYRAIRPVAELPPCGKPRPIDMSKVPAKQAKLSRQKAEEDVAAFLSSGGVIEAIASHQAPATSLPVVAVRRGGRNGD